jgi:hypothetical protein
MSVVTGITIISQCCNESSVNGLVELLNDWIKTDPPCRGGRLVEISEHYGGGKHPECFVWGGGFNYLSWNEFIEYARSLPWKEAMTLPEEERVILVVTPDQRQAEVVFLA